MTTYSPAPFQPCLVTEDFFQKAKELYPEDVVDKPDNKRMFGVPVSVHPLSYFLIPEKKS